MKKIKVNNRDNLFMVYMWVLSYIKPYLFQFSLLVACVFIGTLAELTIPKFIQYFIDDILPQKNINLFSILFAGICIIVIIMVLAILQQNLLQRHVQEKAARDLQYSIYNKLRTLGFSYFESHPIGESLALVNTEVASVQEIYRYYLMWMLKTTLVTFVSIGFMISLSLKLTLLTIPPLLIYYLIGPYIEKKFSALGHLTANKRIVLNQKAYESLVSLHELRANQSIDWGFKNYIESIKEFNDSNLKMHFVASCVGAFRRVSYYLGGILLILYGYHLVQSNVLSTGVFVAFLLYYFISVHMMTTFITSITEQKVLMYQANRLYKFMNIKPDVVEEDTKLVSPSGLSGEVEFKNVTFYYPSGRTVLNDFSFSIKSGERVAIVGPSGSGKTTLIKLLNRFYDPQKGEITLDNIPIKYLSFGDLREIIGTVFQETYLFGSSIKDNILFGKPEANESEVIQAALAANAHDFIISLPDGYDTYVGERGVKLSGGQKQRISIARMLIKNPKVLLLDEATSSLDNNSELEVQKAFDALLKGRTTITVAHRLSTIKDYDKIAFIDKGKITECGTYTELIEKRGDFFNLIKEKKAKVTL